MLQSSLAFLGTLLLIPALAGCQQEVISVRGNSIANQFEQLNKNGWAVGVNDPGNPANHRSALDDPNVRVIKGADFSAVKFNTNFQVDDPKLQAQLQHQNQDQNSAPSQSTPAGLSPFGPAPLIPR